MLFAAVAIPFLIPLALAPHLLFYYDITPKVALIFLGASAALVFAFFHLDSLRAFAGTVSGRWFTFASGASVLISILSAVFSVHPALSWNGSNWRRYGALTECATIVTGLVFAAYAAGQAGRMRAILRAMCAAGIVTSLYGIAQYFGWDPL